VSAIAELLTVEKVKAAPGSLRHPSLTTPNPLVADPWVRAAIWTAGGGFDRMYLGNRPGVGAGERFILPTGRRFVYHHFCIYGNYEST
jgi:hypothetical protein